MIYKRNDHWHMDVMVSGVRYREGLNTTDKREALGLEKKRVGEIQQGRVVAPSARAFARLPFSQAADRYLEDRRGRVAERTIQLEIERLRPLRRHFGEKTLIRIKAEDLGAYQAERVARNVSGRTVNIEVGIIRRMFKKAKCWATLAEDVEMFPEQMREIGRVLPQEQKSELFRVAAARPAWMVAHCAAVLAASTTCRKVELRNLRWRDVDLFKRIISIKRSKRESGRREIPLNRDAMEALARLRERAEMLASDKPEHYVFPSCENGHIDATVPQKTWRTAWRNLTRKAGLPGFRFHDLRHQAITELAESGAPDATLKAIAGHLSQRMLEHYSHVRMAAKREALAKLEGGLMGDGSAVVCAPASAAN